jgi:hypothetical protein
MTITGTRYFVSRAAAIRYYRYHVGEGEDAPYVVERKIAAGEIHIGLTSSVAWTTARYREAAKEAELAGNWGRAIDLWQAAMDNYPDRRGALAKRDLERMEARQNAARAMYFPR